MAYVFQEYPKWVKNARGEAVIVQNAQEEAEITASPDLLAQEDKLIDELEAVRQKRK